LRVSRSQPISFAKEDIMKRVILSIFLGTACSVAGAVNVILEWGGHTSGEGGSPMEYRIFEDRVEIYGEAGQPHPWKFEAWDTHAATEGDIDSITIVSAEPRSGIDLRIAPNPDSEWGAHPYGASNVKRIDLLTNGHPSNCLTTLLLRNNYGDAADGDKLWVGRADTIQIGGHVVVPAGVEKAIDITNWVSGCVTIGGDVLSPVNLPMISGQCRISGDILAPVTLGVVWGPLTVDGAIVEPGSLCWDVNGGDVNLNWDGTHGGGISFDVASAGHTVWCNGSLPQLSVQTIAPGALVQVEGDVTTVEAHHLLADEYVGGTLAINGDVGDLTVDDVPDLAGVYVGGTVNDGQMQECSGDITVGVLTGEFTVETELPGRAYVGTLSGTLNAYGFWGSLTADQLTASGRLLWSPPVNPLGGSVTIGDLAGMVRVGDPYGENEPMHGSIMVTGQMTGNIFLNTGFGAGALVDIEDIGDALFIVNADGPNPQGLDCWETGASVIIGEPPAHSGPDGVNLFVVESCVKGDADGNGVLNAFDIDPFVQMLTDPGAYCGAHAELCGGAAPSDDASFFYRGDLNCDGAVDAFDIDAFTLKLTKPGPTEPPAAPGWYNLYPSSCDPELHRECCTPCAALDGLGAPEGLWGEDLSGEVIGDDSPEAVAQLIVDSVSAEQYPALLAIATQMAAELADPERAALWAEVAAELSGGE
jgi:hypothetical protein